MSTQVAVFLSFLIGFVLCYFLLHASLSVYWSRKIESIDKQKKYDLWVSAWCYCTYRCLEEWNETLESFSKRCADDTFEDWYKTLE